MELTIREMANRLAQYHAEDVCRQLLSAGKREGHRWHVGGLDNSPGRSLHISLSGDDAGRWSDEATGEHGDLIDLWRLTHNLTTAETLREVRGYLGLPNHERTLRSGKSETNRRHYKKPLASKGYATTDTPGGRYLLQRGITPEALQAFKLGEHDGVLEFRYADAEKGAHVHSKFLRIQRPQGKKEMWASKDTIPVLYGWQAIKDTDRRVIICEGEIDAMTLHSLGLPALSIPMGAGAKQGVWIETEYDALERFEEIWVWMDHDAAGQAAVDDIVSRLGCHRVRVVEWPKEANLPEGCDINDLIQRHNYQLKDIAKLVMGAQYRGPEELASAAQFKDEVDATFDIDPKDQMVFPLVWAEPENGQLMDFRPGEISIWSGHGASGKSLILGQMVLYAARRGIRTVIASMEMTPADTLHRMVRQSTALERPDKPFRHEILDWLDDKVWLFKLIGTAKKDRLLEVCRYAVRRYGVTHIVVDSLMKLGLREDDFSGQKILVESLCDFATEMNVHVHLVAHFRKPSGGGGSDDASGFAIKGSGGIRDLAHNVILISRNKTKENVLSDPEASDEEKDKHRNRADAYLTVDKNRRYGWEGKIPLTMDQASMQFIPHRSDPRPIYKREGSPL